MFYKVSFMCGCLHSDLSFSLSSLNSLSAFSQVHTLSERRSTWVQNHKTVLKGFPKDEDPYMAN